jgi:hypothetical protein
MMLHNYDIISQPDRGYGMESFHRSSFHFHISFGRRIMRTLTLARMGRALMIAAAMIMLPQLASAQLPVTTKKLTLQDSDASAGVSLEAAGTTTTSYTLTLPAAVGGQGAFLYAADGTGTLAWSDVTGIQDGWYPRWETTGGGSIVWTDPASVDNPNWSLTGNALAATGKLGTTTLQAVDFITSNVTRMSIAINGKITISDSTDIDGLVQINSGAGTDETKIGTGASAGAVTIGRTGGTLTTIGSLGHTGTSSFTGAVTLAGANSPLVANTGAGTAGDVLVSAGATDTPTWTSLADATGIRARGSVPLTAGDVDEVVTGLTGVVDSDIVIVTLQGTTSAVIGVVTAQAAGGFTVTFSSAIPTGGTPKLNYIVMKP